MSADTRRVLLRMTALGLGAILLAVHYLSDLAGPLSQNIFVSLSPFGCLGAIFFADGMAGPGTAAVAKFLGYAGLFGHALVLLTVR